MHLSIFCPPGGAAGIHGALDRRPFLTGGNLINYGIRVPGNLDFGWFYIPGFDAPSRLKGGDLDKNSCL